jgi:hypothetical protein
MFTHPLRKDFTPVRNHAIQWNAIVVIVSMVRIV